jgi:glucose-6-phosphate isomerase
MTDIKVDIAKARAAAVGPDHGVTPGELKAIAPRIADAHELLTHQRLNKEYGFWDLYKDDVTFNGIRAVAHPFRERAFQNLVILGIGGSALGTTALVSALRPKFYNLMTKRGRKGFPRVFVMDNIDPVSFHEMTRLCKPDKTLYNVISKSGGTAETMSQLMIVMAHLEKKVGANKIKDHLVVTTNPRGTEKSLLHPVADEYGLTEFEVPANVGGRFSVFSPVGMFPAAMLGMDLDAFREGCAAMDARCQNAALKDNPAYLRAAVHYLADTRKGKCISVMMPYADCLYDTADWYRQLWAESLGKKFSLDGEEVYTGQTPVKALGATDQHSQVQLYREGPNDKLINILEVRRFGKTLKIPDTLSSLTDLDYLRGKSMNKLMTAEMKGTIDALTVSQRPVIRVTLPRVNEHAVAQLLYMLEVETAMAGQLYNINAFDQPGVEEGKIRARELMGAGG